MEKKIKEYRKYMDDILKIMEKKDQNNNAEVEALKKEHLIKISFYQHERLIHLLVTAVFAIIELLSIILGVLSPGIFNFLLTIIVLILLLPYIRHYYILENEVQKMYDQYDKLCELEIS